MSKLKFAVSGLMMAAFGLATVPAFAENTPPPSMVGHGPMEDGMMPGGHPGLGGMGGMGGIM